MTTLALVQNSTTALRRGPSDDTALETYFVFGTQFLVRNTDGAWSFGQEIHPESTSPYPGYEGWVRTDALWVDVSDVAPESPQHPPRQNSSPEKPSPEKPSPNRSYYVVDVLYAPVFSGPDIKSQVLHRWPLNARVSATQIGDFIQTRHGYVHTRHVRDATTSCRDTDFVTIAEAHIGAPYVWGGVTPDGLDCSGLVQSALRATGRDAPRNAVDQARMGERVTQRTALRRGDLVFWKGHVGIMQSGSDLLHANAFHMQVKSESLDGAITRIGQTYGPVTDFRRLNLV